ILAWAGLAFASDREQLRDLFERGSLRYDQGDYEGAVAAYREALAISDRGEFHFNIANCYERMGELELAYNELNLYRPTAPQAEQETIDLRMASLRARIAARTQQVALPAPVPPPYRPTALVPDVDPTGETWALLGAGGAVGVGSLVSLGGSFAALGRTADDPARGKHTAAAVWMSASWVGLAGAAGLAIGGVLSSDVRLVPAPEGLAVDVRF
ncbi:MAG: tetratricopeptide repeat protein, partial [Myxococcota bacterium]